MATHCFCCQGKNCVLIQLVFFVYFPSQIGFFCIFSGMLVQQQYGGERIFLFMEKKDAYSKLPLQFSLSAHVQYGKIYLNE